MEVLVRGAMEAGDRHLHHGKTAFERDESLQGWFVRNLQIIGEAARGLPEDVHALAPEIEWAKIIGMRNVLVHGRFDIDAEVVWEAASRDAPALKPRIERLLQRLEERDEAGSHACRSASSLWNCSRSSSRAIHAYWGTVSLPFAPGEHRRIAAKIVDDRGIEGLKEKDLSE